MLMLMKSGMMMGRRSAAGVTPVFVAAGVQAGNATAVPLPSGTLSGHFMIACIHYTTSGSSFTTPSGWTAGTGTTTDDSMRIFWKVAGGSEPSTYNFGTASNAVMLTYSGGLSNIDVEGAYTFDSDFNTTLVAASITALTPGLLLGFYGFQTGGGTLTAPSGMTLRGTAGTGPTLVGYDLIPSGTGSTGTKTLTGSLAFGQSMSVLAQFK